MTNRQESFETTLRRACRHGVDLGTCAPCLRERLTEETLTHGLIRSAWRDVQEGRNHLNTMCRERVPTTELHWVDEAQAQLAQACSRLDMAIPGGVV